MNRLTSFLFSLLVTSILALIANSFNQLWDMPRDMFTPFLIFWYMLWKLFNDKKKDE